MPGRKRNDQPALPGTQSTAELHAVLWRAADKLRGSMDAAQYKDFVLGLVFLKYVSEDASTGDGVFLVPEAARWDRLAVQAGSVCIGELIDGALDAIMRATPALAGVLPKIFGRDNVDQRRLGELVGLIGGARFAARGPARARD